MANIQLTLHHVFIGPNLCVQIVVDGRIAERYLAQSDRLQLSTSIRTRLLDVAESVREELKAGGLWEEPSPQVKGGSI